MDLTLFFRVVWRYRLLVATGLVLAVAAAFFAMFRVTPGGTGALTMRGSEEYSSTSTLFVTQAGFPWGRLDTPSDQASGGAARLATLATLYAKLADSDPVDALNKAELGDKGWSIEAAPVLDGAGLSSPLPLVQIVSLADSAPLARRTAETAAASLQRFVQARQSDNHIAPSDRVVLQIIKGPEKPVLVHGRSITPPIIAFLLIAMVTLALPFLLDNIRRSLAAARIAEEEASRRVAVPPAGAGDAARRRPDETSQEYIARIARTL